MDKVIIEGSEQNSIAVFEQDPIAIFDIDELESNEIEHVFGGLRPLNRWPNNSGIRPPLSRH